jgi:predicted DNA-binding antitoxin AbrB/MazE fold protein
MKTIKAIFDGKHFKPLEPIPIEGKYEAIITFIKPIDTENTKRQKILKHFGTWNEEDVNVINEIIEERANFSTDRDEI